MRSDERTDRARRKALRDAATPEGVRGIADELAITCADCGTPMLILVPEDQRARPDFASRCWDCGVKRYGRPAS